MMQGGEATAAVLFVETAAEPAGETRGEQEIKTEPEARQTESNKTVDLLLMEMNLVRKRVTEQRNNKDL